MARRSGPVRLLELGYAAIAAGLAPIGFALRHAWRETFPPRVPGYVLSAAEQVGIGRDDIVTVLFSQNRITVVVAPYIDGGRIEGLALHLSWRVPLGKEIVVETEGPR